METRSLDMSSSLVEANRSWSDPVSRLLNLSASPLSSSILGGLDVCLRKTLHRWKQDQVGNQEMTRGGAKD